MQQFFTPSGHQNHHLNPHLHDSNNHTEIQSFNSVPPQEREYAKILFLNHYEVVRLGLLAIINSKLKPGRYIQWFHSDSLYDGLDIYKQNPEIDLIILDLNLCDSKGLQGLKLFLNQFPNAKIVVFSSTQDEFVVWQIKMLGAAAYLPKSLLPETIRIKINEVLDQILAHKKKNPKSSMKPIGFFPSMSNYDRISKLGNRHIEILELILSGCSNQEISNSTQLKLGTIKNYVSSIFMILDVKSRSHLISLFG
jgi:NarL family two-component system response regulator LiaR